MNTLSIWKGTAGETDFPELREDLAVDVAIVGGGITGLMTAMLLNRVGKRVAVVEAARIGTGTTGFSTGNLYAVLSDYLFTIGEKWDEATLQAVARARKQAVDLIEDTVKSYGIECSFSRQPLHLFTLDTAREHIEAIEKEYQAALTANLPALLSDTLQSPFQVKKALTIAQQAQFHPLQFVTGLARALASDQCRIFENSKVVVIDEKRGVVETQSGKIVAEHLVLATHTPKGINVLHTELGPYREYGMAARLGAEDFPGGIFWCLGSSRRSLRVYHHQGQRYLLVLGEDHKVGQQENTQTCYQALEDYLRANFAIEAVEYRWSAQHYQSADRLPYIGRSVGSPNLYVATGFGKDGLTYGAVSGLLISDAIVGRQESWSGIFDPRRFNPTKSVKDFLSENLNVAGYYLKDYLQPPEGRSFTEVGNGEGKLIKVDGERIAAYRDEHGQLHLLSPVCTHMKCIVHWNNAEKTWDCPCHGSRFRCDGEVIEGPAIAPLERKAPAPG